MCRDAGMRIVGPNCLGVMNTADAVQLNATFAPNPPTPGRVGFMSQSGGLGIAIVEAAGRAGIGLSSFVSVGNKVDLSGNDMLRYWEQDPGTDLALLYLESFDDPRKFARVAPRFARRKPLLAVKSGRSAAGARATSSHTGALLSASDVTVDALFEQAGVVRTDTLHEMLDVASLLAAQPVPQGGRVAIVTNCRRPGDHVRRCLPGRRGGCARAAGRRQVKARCVPPRGSVTWQSDRPDRDRLGRRLPPDIENGYRCRRVRRDPRDVRAGTRDQSGRCRRRDPRGRSYRAGGSDRGGVHDQRRPSGGVELHRSARTRLRVSRGRSTRDLARGQVRALARAAGAVADRAPSGIRANEAAAIISRELAGGSGWLSAAGATGLLDCYGLPLVPTRIASDVDEAVAAAAELGTPVALKAIATGLLHKTDAGGVQAGADRRRCGAIRSPRDRRRGHARGL